MGTVDATEALLDCIQQDPKIDGCQSIKEDLAGEFAPPPTCMFEGLYSTSYVDVGILKAPKADYCGAD